MARTIAAGCAALNSVLGILLVVAVQRLKVWDEAYAAKYEASNGKFDRAALVPGTHNGKNHAAFVRAFGDPRGSTYCKAVFKAIYDGEWAPMHFSIQLFPWAIVSYISAVTVKVICAAGDDKTSAYYAVGATCTIMVGFAAPMLYYGRKMLALVVA